MQNAPPIFWIDSSLTGVKTSVKPFLFHKSLTNVPSHQLIGKTME